MRGDERKTGMKKKKVSKAGNQSYVGALPLLLSFCSFFFFFLKKERKREAERNYDLYKYCFAEIAVLSTQLH